MREHAHRQTLPGSYAGKSAHEAPDLGLLALLARYYNEVADLRPQLDLIPLFPFASWSLGTWSALVAEDTSRIGICLVRA